MLIAVRAGGEIVERYDLDSHLFYQPEGLLFLSNGDMLIANEGKHVYPSLVSFSIKN